jgi:hypothetical protein
VGRPRFHLGAPVASVEADGFLNQGPVRVTDGADQPGRSSS